MSKDRSTYAGSKYVQGFYVPHKRGKVMWLIHNHNYMCADRHTTHGQIDLRTYIWPYILDV